MHQSPAPQPSPSGLNTQDILYVLFKHKWKILLLTVLGLGAAAAVFFTKAEVYESRAKLLVRYVHGHSDLDKWEVQEQAGGRYGEHIINTEIEILTTWDLALAVVDAIGVDTLLPEETDAEPEPVTNAEKGKAPEAGENKDSPDQPEPPLLADGSRRALAAKQILDQLKVVSAKGSNVLHLAYQHEKPALAREILDELIEQYFYKHAATHRPVRKELADLERKSTTAANELSKAEFDLSELQKQLRSEAQGETTASLEAQRTAVKSGLLQAEASYAQQRTKLELLGELDGKAGDEDGEELPVGVVAVPPSHVVQQFEESLALARSLQLRRVALLEKFTPGHQSVRNIQSQLDAEGARQARLLKEHPGLGAATTPSKARGESVFDPRTEGALLAALKTKVETFQKQLTELDSRYRSLSSLDGQIAELTAKIAAKKAESEELTDSLKLAQVEKKITEGSLPNISILQHPSLAGKTLETSAKTVIGGLAASGLVLGVALAFLIEFVFDRRVKRPAEIESRMRLPLMLSIPKLEMKRQPLRLTQNGADGEAGRKVAAGPDEWAINGGPDAAGFLPYAEAIRDRLVYYFALNDMTHRPKMIALAGLSPGSGASTLAAGVAAAFAKAEARTLLVDLNPVHKNSSSQLLANRDSPQLPSASARNGAELGFDSAGENLYVASLSTPNGKGLASLAPRKFYDLIPKFRSSDFDYIVFDMPALGDTSPTAAMAGFMDKVLLVLDAENTDRSDLKRAYGDLMRGKADVSCVFNKTRSHGPRWALGAV